MKLHMISLVKVRVLGKIEIRVETKIPALKK
jgi:hypothetical protein